MPYGRIRLMENAVQDQLATQDVEAPITYIVDTGEKPVSASYGPAGR